MYAHALAGIHQEDHARCLEQLSLMKSFQIQEREENSRESQQTEEQQTRSHATLQFHTVSNIHPNDVRDDRRAHNQHQHPMPPLGKMMQPGKLMKCSIGNVGFVEFHQMIVTSRSVVSRLYPITGVLKSGSVLNLKNFTRSSSDQRTRRFEEPFHDQIVLN